MLIGWLEKANHHINSTLNAFFRFDDSIYARVLEGRCPHSTRENDGSHSWVLRVSECIQLFFQRY